MKLSVNERLALFFRAMRFFKFGDMQQKTTLAKNLYPFKQFSKADLLRQLRQAEQDGTGDTDFLTHLANHFDADFDFLMGCLRHSKVKNKERWLRQWFRWQEKVNQDYWWADLVVEHPAQPSPRYCKIELSRQLRSRLRALRLAQRYAQKKGLRVCLHYYAGDDESVSVWINADGTILEIIDEADIILFPEG